jgi:hypothetical protein
LLPIAAHTDKDDPVLTTLKRNDVVSFQGVLSRVPSISDDRDLELQECKFK